MFVNLAVSGSATAEEIHYRTARHGAYVPEVLILAVGVNDLARDITDGSPFSGTNVAGVAANYRKIVAAVRAKNPRVAIMIDSVLPENTGNLRHGTVAGLNARLRSLAEELNEPDSPIHFNDLCGQLENGVLPSRPYYMSRGSAHFYAVDELHVRPEGQNWRACRWLDAFGFDVADAQPQYTSWVALKRRQGEKNAVVFGDQLTGRLHVGLTPLRAANPGIGSVLVRVTDLTTRNVWSKTANVSSGGSENALEFDLRHVAEHPLRVECLGFGSAADDVAVYAFDAFAGSLADGRFRPE